MFKLSPLHQCQRHPTTLASSHSVLPAHQCLLTHALLHGCCGAVEAPGTRHPDDSCMSKSKGTWPTRPHDHLVINRWSFMTLTIESAHSHNLANVMLQCWGSHAAAVGAVVPAVVHCPVISAGGTSMHPWKPLLKQQNVSPSM